MAALSNCKDLYNTYSKHYGAIIAKFERHGEALRRQQGQGSVNGIVQIKLVRNFLNIASYQILLHMLYLQFFNVPSTLNLNNARKNCYNCVILFEQLLGRKLDLSHEEHVERLASIKDYPMFQRFSLMRLLGFTIQHTEESMGTNSKSYWQFVELYGRFVCIAYNVVDMRALIKGFDPRREDYEEIVQYVELLKLLLDDAAKRYRVMYESKTQRIVDMRWAIAFLNAQARVRQLFFDQKGYEEVKRKIEVWKLKLIRDTKNEQAF